MASTLCRGSTFAMAENFDWLRWRFRQSWSRLAQLLRSLPRRGPRTRTTLSCCSPETNIAGKAPNSDDNHAEAPRGPLRRRRTMSTPPPVARCNEKVTLDKAVLSALVQTMRTLSLKLHSGSIAFVPSNGSISPLPGKESETLLLSVKKALEESIVR